MTLAMRPGYLHPVELQCGCNHCMGAYNSGIIANPLNYLWRSCQNMAMREKNTQAVPLDDSVARKDAASIEAEQPEMVGPRDIKHAQGRRDRKVLVPSSDIEKAITTIPLPEESEVQSPPLVVTPKPKPPAKAGANVTKVIVSPLLKPTTGNEMAMLLASRKSKKMAAFWFVALFVLPSAFVACYYSFVATPMYVSEMQLALRQNDGGVQQHQGDLLAAVFNSPTNSNIMQNIRIVQSYMLSGEMLEAVNQTQGVQEHFSDKNADYYSRLRDAPTRNTFQKYWNWAVSSRVDVESGLILVSAKAFSPEKAVAITRAMLAEGEEFVNRLNGRLHEDAMENARAELARAETRLKNASVAIENFRRQYGVMDTESVAATRVGIIDTLEAELAKGRAEMAARSPFIAENSAEMKILRARLQALEAQVEQEKARIAGDAVNNNFAVSVLANDYESRVMEQEFARQQYTTAMASVESARIQKDTQALYLVPVVTPTVPDESLYPERLKFIAAFMAINFSVYLLLTVFGAAVKDHLMN